MRDRTIIVITSLIYVILILHLASLLCVKFSDIRGYSCAVNVPFENLFIILVAFVSIIPSFFIPKNTDAAEVFFLQMVYLFHVIPSIVLTLVYLDEKYWLEIIIWVLFMSFSFSLILVLSFKVPSIKIKDVKFKGTCVIFILLAIGLLFVYVIIRDAGFSLSLPSVFDVYGIRAQYKESISKSGAYATIIGGYFVAPFLILMAIRNGIKNVLSLIMIFLSLFLVFVIFSNSGIKSIAFIPFASISLYIILRKIKNFVLFLQFLPIGMILFGYIASAFFGFDAILIHWCRRFIMASGSNTAKFFEYFVLNGNTPSADAPTRISEYYYGTLGSANTGLYGDAIGRYGLEGLLFNLVLLFIMVWIIKSLTKDIDKSIVCTMLFFMGYAACNSSLLTILVSYGFVFLVLFVFLMRKTRFFN